MRTKANYVYWTWVLPQTWVVITDTKDCKCKYLGPILDSFYTQGAFLSETYLINDRNYVNKLLWNFTLSGNGMIWIHELISGQNDQLCYFPLLIILILFNICHRHIIIHLTIQHVQDTRKWRNKYPFSLYTLIFFPRKKLLIFFLYLLIFIFTWTCNTQMQKHLLKHTWFLTMVCSTCLFFT